MGESQQGAGRPLPADAAIALASGRTIDAIKAAVHGNPVLKTQYEAGLEQAKRRLFRWVFIINFVLIAIVAWWIFSR